jgi:serine/threonine protein kinase
MPNTPSTQAAPADPLLGQTVAGRYRVLREIGRGGMGFVYEAEDTDGRRVAIKTLSHELASHEASLHRFRREAKIIASVEHPSIVRYLDVGETKDGQPFVVLELLRGRSLDAELEASGPLPAGRAVRIALKIAAALSAAHAVGVVHRDLKPENVFLEGEDDAKVLDFGVSKLLGPLMGPGTRTGELLGTPNYMAPEQVHDARSANETTDVYGLGAILYQMLTGRPPFLTASLGVMLLQIMVESPPSLAAQRPDVPAPLVEVIERAMARSNTARWPSMAAFSEALAPFADLRAAPRLVPLPYTPTTGTMTPPSIVATPPPTVRVARRTAPWMLLAVLAIVAAGVGLYYRGRALKRGALDTHRGEAVAALLSRSGRPVLRAR